MTRYGGSVGDTNYRVYARYLNRDGNKLSDGRDASDEADDARTGFRSDTQLSERELLTVQGDYYYRQTGFDLNRPSFDAPNGFEQVDLTNYINGGDLLARYTVTHDSSSETSIQVYTDRNDRNEQVVKLLRSTSDLDIQHRLAPSGSHDVILGGQYRYYYDDIDNTEFIKFDPAEQSSSLFTGFVQDEYTIIPDTFKVIGGIKLEKLESADLQPLPNLRAIYFPTEHTSVWTAVSRAARIPARTNTDTTVVYGRGRTPTGIPVSVIYPADDPDAHERDTELWAYEAGFRWEPIQKLSLDTAFYYNRYNRMGINAQVGPFLPAPDGSGLVAELSKDEYPGHVYGAEASLDWRLARSFRFVPGFTFTQVRQRADDAIVSSSEGSSPQYQAFARANWDITPDWQLDTTVRYVDSLIFWDISSYLQLDLRVGYRLSADMELALIGRNLLDDKHMEFSAGAINYQDTEIERSVLLNLLWRY